MGIVIRGGNRGSRTRRQLPQLIQLDWVGLGLQLREVEVSTKGYGQVECLRFTASGFLQVRESCDLGILGPEACEKAGRQDSMTENLNIC